MVLDGNVKNNKRQKEFKSKRIKAKKELKSKRIIVKKN
jgi:hypothetical protein